MISYLEGKIISRGSGHVIVVLGDSGYKDCLSQKPQDGLGSGYGIGYKIRTNQETLDALTGKEHGVFWTYLAVRENALDLYGFLSEETLGFFELLITISGIGPKTALSILNLASVKTLRSAVLSGDASRLTKVSGIGKKNAEKIVMELSGKISGGEKEADDMSDVEMRDESDVLEALKELGYSERSAREALKKIDKKIVGTSERLKQALKGLAK